MEKKEVTIGNPVVVAGVTLIPVTRVSLNYWCGNGGISSFGIKQPVSVVIVSPSDKRAFSVTGEEVSLAQLIQDVPGVSEILAGSGIPRV